MKEKLHPFKELNKQEIIEELISRKIYDINTNIKCEIEKILKKEMCGIQRGPSLLYHNPSINFLNKHLAKYEISSIEPMHDICGHIKNIFTELPSVLNENEKKVFNEIYQITIGNKQCKRACDYRLAIGYCFGNEEHITASNIGTSSYISRNSKNLLFPREGKNI